MAESAPQTCGAAVDIGNRWAKAGLSWTNKDGRLEISRVPFNILAPDNQFRPSPSQGKYDILTFIGLDAYNDIVIGPRALAMDRNWSYKEMAFYRAVGKRHAVERLPGGPDLLEAVQQGHIDGDMMDYLLRQLLDATKYAIMRHASRHGLEVRDVCLTFPMYLCHGEQKHPKYHFVSLAYLKKQARKVFGTGVGIWTSSEGQAEARQLCTRFYDPVAGSNRQFIRELFADLDTSTSLPIIVLDWGSSSLNIQVQMVSFDDSGDISTSQSIVLHGLVSGVRGGSDLLNSEIKKLLRHKLRSSTTVRPGDLASYVQDFDRLKADFNFAQEGAPKDVAISLRGPDRSRSIAVDLTREELTAIFQNVAGPGLRAIKTTFNRVRKFGKDFAVWGRGGTLKNKGFHARVTELVKDAQKNSKSITISAAFASQEEEDHSSSSVAIGAALSVHNIPEASKIISRAAIGLHVLNRRSVRSPWNGEADADVLLTTGDDSRQRMRVYVHVGQGVTVRRNVKFALVCDPSYLDNLDNCLDDEANTKGKGKGKGKATKTELAPIKIWDGRSLRSNTDPASTSTYDLGWTVRAEHLPRGMLCFTLAFVANEKKSIIAILSCCQVDRDGNTPASHDPLDAKWRLTLSPDPATRCLNIQNPQKLPHWCSQCNKELSTTVRVCETCENFNLCSYCSMRIGDRHQHPFKSMDFNTEEESDSE